MNTTAQYMKSQTSGYIQMVGNSNAPTPVDPCNSPIQSQLDTLSAVICSLTDALDKLTGKLAPAMATNTGAPINADTCVKGSSPLNNQLAQRNYELVLLCERINGLTMSVEL